MIRSAGVGSGVRRYGCGWMRVLAVGSVLGGAGILGGGALYASGPTVSAPAPSSQTLFAGANAQMSVTVSGTGPFTYYWQVDGGSGYNTLTDGGRISGSGAATLTISDTETSDSGEYRCLVSNAGGQANSGPATLTVNLPPPPSVSSPSNQTVIVGGTATFSVTASGTGPFTYYWQSSSGGTFGNLANGGQISGASTSTLTISGVQTSNAGSYRCLVSNAGGQSNSGSATLTVDLPPPPSVSSPSNQTVIVGGTATFSVTASGTGPFTYYWQSSSGGTFSNLANGGQISGANTSALTIRGAQTSNAGSYRCLVSNAGGQTNSGSATLTVDLPPPPSVTAPSNQTLLLGGTATFSVTASGTGPFTYYWQSSTGGAFSNLANGGQISGASTSTLTIGSVQTSNAGSYRCLVSNAGGQTNSGSATLTVSLPPPPTVSAPLSQTVFVGQTATFSVSASGTAPLTYLWQVNTGSGFVNLSDGGRVSGSATATLSISSVQTNNAGSFRCLVSNAGGQSNSGLATLTVNVPPPPMVSAPASVAVVTGSTVTFAVSASGQGPLTYFWQYSSGSGFVNLSDGGRVSGSATATLTITSVETSDAGSYRCVVANAFGQTNSGPGTLTVLVPTPPVVSQPASLAVGYGSTAVFAVTATGEGPLVYQWQVSAGGSGSFVNLSDGGRISGSATPTLTISNVQASDAGSYRCLASNPVAQTNSGAAALAVGTPDFALVVSPTSRGVAQGASVLYTVSVSSQYGFSSGVTLTLSGLDPHSTSSFSVDPVAGGSGSSNLAVYTSATTPAGSQTLTLSATGGGQTHSATITLLVNAAPVPSLAVTLSAVQASVTPGGSGLFQVNVNGSNLAADVSLTATAPSGITPSFDNASVAAGGTANLTLSTTAATAAGSYPFTVTATADGATASVSGTLSVQTAPAASAPTLVTISPNTVVAGQVTVVTVLGSNLQNVTLSIPTSQAVQSQPVQRVFPGATMQSVSADGTSMQVSIDATTPGVLDFYNLAAGNGGSQAVTQFRVLPPGPIVDNTSPGTPVPPGSISMLSLVGAHLRNVTLSMSPPGAVSISNLDTTEDERLNALLMVPPGAAAGNVSLTLTDLYGQSFTTYITIGSAGADVGVALKARVIGSLPGVASAATPIYLHPFRRRQAGATRVVSPGVLMEDWRAPAARPADDFSISFSFSSTFSLYSFYWRTIIVENPVTQVIGSQALQQLVLGQASYLSAYVLSAYVEVDASVYWNIDSSGDFTFPEFCFSFVTGGEIPGQSQYPGVFNYSYCDGTSGTGTTTGSTSDVEITGQGSCAQIDQTQLEEGTAFASVTQQGCCNQPIDIAASGTTFLGTYFAADFDFDEPAAVSTSPDPTVCSCPCAVSATQQATIQPGNLLTLVANVTNTSSGTCTYNVNFVPDESGLLQVNAGDTTLQVDGGQSAVVTATVSVAPNVPANTTPSVTVNACTGGSLQVNYCVIPSGETSTWYGWQQPNNNQNIQTYFSGFYATPTPTTTDFTGRQVTESEARGATDTCYNATAGGLFKVPNFNAVPLLNNPSGASCPPTNSGGTDGSCWTVGQTSGVSGELPPETYGLDAIGLGYAAPVVYNNTGSSLPCLIAVTQQMYIDCPWNPVLYNSHLVEIDVAQPTFSTPVIISRGGAPSQGSPPPPPPSQ